MNTMQTHLIVGVLISFLLVLLGRKLALIFFNLFEKRFFEHYIRKDKSLEELIRAKEFEYGKVRVIPTPGPQKEVELIEGPKDPQDEARKVILHKIYNDAFQKKKSESDRDFYIRILNLTTLFKPDDLKRAYKKKSKEFHPDCFDVSLFDAKTQLRLKSRIHQNYLVIQSANNYFKKEKKAS
jgi:hypothetical protein